MEANKIEKLAENIAIITGRLLPIKTGENVVDKEVLNALATLKEDCENYCRIYDKYFN